MKCLRTFVICGGLAVLYALPLFTLPGIGAIFLKIDTIPGESTDSDHKDWIEILSFSHGTSEPTPGTTGTGQGGRECIQDLSFTKFIDKSSPKLMLQCLKGTQLADATLVVTADDGSGTGAFYEYLTIKLIDVVVSSVANAGDSSSPDRPVESFAINFTKIEYSYTENDAAKTKTEVRWDFEQNQEY
ncbi:MAG: type VI secretion system tube protein Hcp [Akkermansiaceae bacterium]|nr:type VI secretion system tube protein Hcp [Akkermansiaceae bacterium]NNM29856.1 type VI secretion system tube protein Hcp [Akkermansiaceae bacterium]